MQSGQAKMQTKKGLASMLEIQLCCVDASKMAVAFDIFNFTYLDIRKRERERERESE